MQGEASGCVYEFKRDMSERVHFKILYFIALYTNWGTWGDYWGYKGVHTSSQLFPIMHPWVILVKNTFI